MNLHNYTELFDDLTKIVASSKGLRESAIKRDYFIVLMLKKLVESEYGDYCVFKGGTSLSKCYPGSIERFSEDIDLTYLGMTLNNNICDKKLKKIELIMTSNMKFRKNNEERNQRNKSSYVWFSSEEDGIKLEIGCNVKPDPYSKRVVKSYIQEYLEKNNKYEIIKKYGLNDVKINTLDITRTFVDKLMAVKRHAICGNLKNKVRHIYDVVMLYKMPEIKKFLSNDEELKRIVQMTKQTDSHYLAKRKIPDNYNPLGAYDFNKWSYLLDDSIKIVYERLHNVLLYVNIKQEFNLAIRTFQDIDSIIKKICE